MAYPKFIHVKVPSGAPNTLWIGRKTGHHYRTAIEARKDKVVGRVILPNPPNPPDPGTITPPAKPATTSNTKIFFIVAVIAVIIIINKLVK